MKKLCIIGSNGAQSKYVIETMTKKLIFRKENIKIIGYNEEDYNIIKKENEDKSFFIVCHGNNKTKKILFNKIKEILGNRLLFISLHPNAIISLSATIKEGTIVNAGSIIQPDAIVGKCCMIHSNSVIEHDCKIDNFVNIAPGATICGGVRINEGSYIFANSTIIPNIEIGKNAIIGAGSIVLRNVKENETVYGIVK